MKKNKTLLKITQRDYDEMMEILIECSCNWPNRPSLLEVAQDLLTQTTDFYEEITLRLLIRLHNYGEIDLNKHFCYADDEEAKKALKQKLN